MYSSISKNEIAGIQADCLKVGAENSSARTKFPPRDAEWYVAPTSFFDSPSESPEKKSW